MKNIKVKFKENTFLTHKNDIYELNIEGTGMYKVTMGGVRHKERLCPTKKEKLLSLLN